MYSPETDIEARMPISFHDENHSGNYNGQGKIPTRIRKQKVFLRESDARTDFNWGPQKPQVKNNSLQFHKFSRGKQCG